MASTPTQKPLLLLPILLVLSLISVSAAARPCKTFFIASYSFSIKSPYPDSNPNPNSSGFVAIITEISQLQQPQPISSSSSSSSSSGSFQFFPGVDGDNNENDQHQQIQRNQGPLLPFGLSSSSSSYDMISLRDRTKDILSVVVALLFGVGCGALTAATMYLVWSLFSSPDRDYYSSYEKEFDDDEEDVKEEEENLSPKKMGYVKIAGLDSSDEIEIPARLLEKPVGR